MRSAKTLGVRTVKGELKLGATALTRSLARGAVAQDPLVELDYYLEPVLVVFHKLASG